MKVMELHPVDGRKSFYGKAVVLVFSDGTEILRIYQTDIVKRNPDGTLERLWEGWSATTGRHIKAFCGLDKKGFDRLPYPWDNPCVRATRYTVSPDEVRDYAERQGKAAAASWLLLIPPDSFDGDYEAMMGELCGVS